MRNDELPIVSPVRPSVVLPWKRVVSGASVLLLTLLVSACGVFTDVTPPDVYASLIADEGHVTGLEVTGNDAESGITHLSVERVLPSGARELIAAESFPARDEDGNIVATRSFSVAVSATELQGAVVTARNGVKQVSERQVLQFPLLPDEVEVGEELNAVIALGAHAAFVDRVSVLVNGSEIPVVPAAHGDFTFQWRTALESPGWHSVIISVEFGTGEVLVERYQVRLVASTDN